ncbi:peptidase [bacterium]|nr:peptidase [bacterium]
MKHTIRVITAIIIVSTIALIIGCERTITMEKAPLDYVESELAKLAPVSLTTDLSYLPAEEVQVIKLLVKAGQLMDKAFLRQVSQDNVAIKKALSKDGQTAYGDLFNIMFGPWNRLDEHHAFLNETEKPKGAGFYPADMTETEFHQWLTDHPEDTQAFEHTFTIISRDGKDLKAIPYSEYFKAELKPAAKLLREAAELTSDKTLAVYLRSRAASFESNDYYQSDMDWMDLAGDIEIVIGPYEVYEDGLFGYKAAFESFLCVVDHNESDNLKKIGDVLDDLERALPIADKHKNFERGSESPFKVVNEIFAAGDTKAGVQTLAFNLPNDERVREAKGSKKVMLKNVMEAKYDKILTSICDIVLEKEAKSHLAFDSYFKHILMHEVSHGLGPGTIEKDGKTTTVNRELKDLYSTIEEAKADVLGMYTCELLIDKNIFPRDMRNSLYETNLGGMFRSIRFGIGEAHGGGVAIQMNYYLDKGAVKVDNDGKFRVNKRLYKKAVKSLAKKLLIIEAEGDYEAAKKLVEKYVVVRPEVQTALDMLNDVPVDIRPSYPIERELN